MLGANVPDFILLGVIDIFELKSSRCSNTTTIIAESRVK